jgi:hypothetical protein
LQKKRCSISYKPGNKIKIKIALMK